MPILKELGATNLRNKVKSYDYIIVADEKAGPSKVDDARSKGVTFVTEDELVVRHFEKGREKHLFLAINPVLTMRLANRFSVSCVNQAY